MTKKELLEAIKDMPEDANVKVVVKISDGRTLVVNNVKITTTFDMIILRNQDYANRNRLLRL